MSEAIFSCAIFSSAAMATVAEIGLALTAISKQLKSHSSFSCSSRWPCHLAWSGCRRVGRAPRAQLHARRVRLLGVLPAGAFKATDVVAQVLPVIVRLQLLHFLRRQAGVDWNFQGLGVMVACGRCGKRLCRASCSTTNHCRLRLPSATFWTKDPGKRVSATHASRLSPSR